MDTKGSETGPLLSTKTDWTLSIARLYYL